MGLLNKKIVRPLELGQHRLNILSVEEGIASNGNEYLIISFKADGETDIRRRVLWERDLDFMRMAVEELAGMEFDEVADMMAYIQDNGLDVWIVRNVKDDQTYINWYFKEPVEKHVTTRIEDEIPEDL